MIMRDWEELTDMCENCKMCRLSDTRKNVVIERGNRNAPLMFIGEGPGEQEDIQGRPFVGRAGNFWICCWRRWELKSINTILQI